MLSYRHGSQPVLCAALARSAGRRVLPPRASAASEPAALPDAATMLREVEAHQKQLDKMRENYTFRAVQTTRQLDSSGNTKKVETEEHEVFFVNGHQVEKLVRKDGKDLTPDQARKEQDRVNKEVLKISQPGYTAILTKMKSRLRGCCRLLPFPGRAVCA